MAESPLVRLLVELFDDNDLRTLVADRLPDGELTLSARIPPKASALEAADLITRQSSRLGQTGELIALIRQLRPRQDAAIHQVARAMGLDVPSCTSPSEESLDAPVRWHNLPPAPEGIETEHTHDLLTLLDEHPFVTLSGRKGSGKSTLALAVGRAWLARSPHGDGPVHVNLVTAESLNQIAERIADTLRWKPISEDPARIVEETAELLRRQRRGPLLLILDHVPTLSGPERALLGPMLRPLLQTVGHALLVLRHTWPVPSIVEASRSPFLKSSIVDGLRPPEALALCHRRWAEYRAALPLYVEGADTAYVSTAELDAVFQELVARAGCNPGVIVDVLSLETLPHHPLEALPELAARRLAGVDGLDVHVDPTDAAVLAQCAQFQNGFYKAIAAQVVTTPGSSGPPDFHRLLESRRLILVQPKMGSISRFELHDQDREQWRKHPPAGLDLDAFWGRFFPATILFGWQQCKRIREAGGSPLSRPVMQFLATLQEERDNLREAVKKARERQQTTLALRGALALTELYRRRGPVNAEARTLEEAVRLLRDDPRWTPPLNEENLAARALLSLATLERDRDHGSREAARTHTKAALESLDPRRPMDAPLLAQAERLLADLDMRDRAFDAAMQHLDRASGFSEGVPEQRLRTEIDRARLLRRTGQHLSARDLLRGLVPEPADAVALDPGTLCSLHMNLGLVERHLLNLTSAQEHLGLAQRHAEAAGDLLRAIRVGYQLCQLALDTGELPLAESAMTQAKRAFRTAWEQGDIASPPQGWGERQRAELQHVDGLRLLDTGIAGDFDGGRLQEAATLLARAARDYGGDTHHRDAAELDRAFSLIAAREWAGALGTLDEVDRRLTGNAAHTRALSAFSAIYRAIAELCRGDRDAATRETARARTLAGEITSFPAIPEILSLLERRLSGEPVPSLAPGTPEPRDVRAARAVLTRQLVSA